MRIYARFACPMLIKRKNNPLNIRKFEIKDLNLQSIIYSIPPLTKRWCQNLQQQFLIGLCHLSVVYASDIDERGVGVAVSQCL